MLKQIRYSIYSFLAISILFLGSAHAQVRQTHLYIDDGTGHFSVLTAATGGGTITLPASGTLLTSGSTIGASTTWNGNLIGAAYGGTGLDITPATKGQLLYTSATGTWDTLNAGTANQVLTMNSSGVPAWAAASGGSSGITTFGYVYDLSPVGQTVAGGADVTFSNNGPLSGVTHTAGTTSLTVPTAGTYDISFSVNTTAGVGAAIAIAVNGSVDASTNVNLLVATGLTSGHVMLTLTSGDILTLRDNSATPFTLDSAPGAGAMLTAKLLS